MRSREKLTLGIILTIAVISAMAPFATDMYLPAMPQLGAELGATDSQAQVTISAFMIGMAVGQLLIGPISDSVGRYKLLLGSGVLAALSGVASAIAPTIGVLIVARVVLGFGAGACMVLARSMIPDLAKGKETARAFSILMAVQAIGPVIAPVLGGILTEPIGWRGIMWVLAAIAVLQLVLAVFVLGETLPPERRSAGGLKSFATNLKSVFSRRPFIWYVVSSGMNNAAFFCYISGSAFVFQNQLGLSVGQYTAMFALFAVLMGVFSTWNTNLSRRFDLARITRVVLAVQMIGTGLIVVAGFATQNFWVVFLGTMIAVAPNAINLANVTTLGTNAAGERAGTGQAMLGAAQFALGAIFGPLVGIGENQVLSMGLVMLVCLVVAAVALELAQRAEAKAD